MRILLDECLPVQLRHIFSGHDARTVSYMGWRSLRNGDLLKAAAREGFNIFVTADARIPPSDQCGLALIVVPTNRRKVLDAMTEMLRATVNEVRPGECRTLALPARSDGPRPG